MNRFRIPRFPRAYLLFALLTTTSVCVFAQPIDMDKVRAREEFRWGVTAFHSGLFGEAVLSFERALAYDPDDLLTVEWLGRAYYRSGFEETALALWRRVVEGNRADATLLNFLETLRYRRGVSRDLREEIRYVEAYTLEGTQPDFTLFSRPASVFPRSNGGFFVSSFAGNQVLRFDANAALDARILGGLGGLDHPFDVVETEEGRLYVSEFLGNRIFSSDGDGAHAFRFGERGTGEGQLLGPQYLAVDDLGYLYVSESGNRRVSKFDLDGNFVLSFGRPTEDFAGFMSPTGVVVYRNRVYVCDQRDDAISVFDTSGNYIRTIAENMLSAPEGLSVYDDGRLLLADSNGLKIVDIEQETVTPLTDETVDAKKMTKAAIDANGNILVSDFTANTVSVFTDFEALYTGLVVEVYRIDSSAFPTVTVEVGVHTRDGRPVVGLDESNFVLTERIGTIEEPIMLDIDETQSGRLAVVIEDSPRVDPAATPQADALGGWYRAMSGYGGLEFYRAGSLPAPLGDSAEPFESLLRRMAVGRTGRESWRLDAAVRLAASGLTVFPGSRAVVLVTSGDLGDSPFREYPPDVLAAFLRNNGIAFYSVYLNARPVDFDVIEYLCAETGGRSYYVFRPQGVGELASRVLDAATGRYFFRYESRSRSDFGEAYIPVEAEVVYFRRSGRGGSAYFPPLEY